jgi:hypothetical protein
MMLATLEAFSAPKPFLLPRIVTVSSRTKLVVIAIGVLPVLIASTAA